MPSGAPLTGIHRELPGVTASLRGTPTESLVLNIEEPITVKDETTNRMPT
jgi:hypothetical protein